MRIVISEGEWTACKEASNQQIENMSRDTFIYMIYRMVCDELDRTQRTEVVLPIKVIFVASALKPAEINRVEIADDSGVARVWLDEDQRSLAIGRMGQNIQLASRLAGVNIELVQSDKAELEQQLRETL